MIPAKHRYFIVNKPYAMVSQFVSPHSVRLLADLDFDFPEGIHAIGRLDNESEGLLILTTNKKVTKLLFESKTAHQRTYLVQVSHSVSEENLNQLSSGIFIKIKSGEQYLTKPCTVSILVSPESLCFLEERIVAYPPFTWIRITLTEGKYHQVRKMITAIGKKCKRLVRISIENLELGDLKPGEVLEISESAFFKMLRISN
ncbi:MAG: pseudouridine synthase [Saprospiraceae bacterium]